VLDLNGNARIGVDGSLFYGDDPTFNVTGNDSLDATGGLSGIFGTINLADHADLVLTGKMSFGGYGMGINGSAGSLLTNNGTIKTANGNISTAVNGQGTIGLSQYHDGHGSSAISAPIGYGQTVDLNGFYFGMTLALSDPADFHGLLKIEPATGDVSVVLEGVHATRLINKGNQLVLKNRGHTVDTLRVDNVGHVPVTASFGATDTTLTFHTALPHLPS
jgi:hypothetical protein